jgi:transposase
VKQAQAEKRCLLFVDEAAFYLLPGVARSYAPRGQTPVLHHVLSRDHLSVISAWSPQGRLFFSVRESSFDSEAVIVFLKRLLNEIDGQITLIWDGAPIHRSKLIKSFLSEGAAQRLHLERLPGYAPDLNPDEGVWNWLKNVEMRNQCLTDIAHLKRELRRGIERMRHKRRVIGSFLNMAKLAPVESIC